MTPKSAPPAVVVDTDPAGDGSDPSSSPGAKRADPGDPRPIAWTIGAPLHDRGDPSAEVRRPTSGRTRWSDGSSLRITSTRTGHAGRARPDPLLHLLHHTWRSGTTPYGPLFVVHSAFVALISGTHPLLYRLAFQLTAVTRDRDRALADLAHDAQHRRARARRPQPRGRGLDRERRSQRRDGRARAPRRRVAAHARAHRSRGLGALRHGADEDLDRVRRDPSRVLDRDALRQARSARAVRTHRAVRRHADAPRAGRVALDDEREQRRRHPARDLEHPTTGLVARAHPQDRSELRHGGNARRPSRSPCSPPSSAGASPIPGAARRSAPPRGWSRPATCSPGTRCSACVVAALRPTDRIARWLAVQGGVITAAFLIPRGDLATMPVLGHIVWFYVPLALTDRVRVGHDPARRRRPARATAWLLPVEPVPLPRSDRLERSRERHRRSAPAARVAPRPGARDARPRRADRRRASTR